MTLYPVKVAAREAEMLADIAAAKAVEEYLNTELDEARRRTLSAERALARFRAALAEQGVA